MSRRRKPQNRNPARERLAALAASGQVLKGECPDCDSETRLVDTGDGVFVARIAHDDTCPTWARIQKERTR